MKTTKGITQGKEESMQKILHEYSLMTESEKGAFCAFATDIKSRRGNGAGPLHTAVREDGLDYFEADGRLWGSLTIVGETHKWQRFD
ncbi:hypothetical protein [Terasakiella sp. SH-1]|uniref:hypothetical protein n=1 Tax=Terasakiella sp. SH-1 TaxID=2560057 RepID=UPI001073E009|nr:hypothetical protein [Terasakiella sp. SH-1]